MRKGSKNGHVKGILLCTEEKEGGNRRDVALGLLFLIEIVV